MSKGWMFLNADEDHAQALASQADIRFFACANPAGA
jgi:hypothetical protein